MTTLELERKALDIIDDSTFRCGVYASEGGKCSDGWGDSLDLELTKAELLYLIKERVSNDDAFEGMATESVNVEEIIDDMTCEAAWPDGGPTASVNSVIPKEMKSLSGEIDELNMDDPDSVSAMRDRLKSIKGGEYTFSFTVTDGDRMYYFTEDAEETINLTADQIIGLLWGHHGIDELFDGLCEKPLDEELINDKADEKGFACNYDYFSYGGESEELEGFLNAWETLFDKIEEGIVTEDTLEKWLEYFDDSDNYEYGIEEWYEDNCNDDN